MSEIYNTQLAQGRLDDAGDFPKVVLVDTISHCNLRCSMCVHPDMIREKGVMSWPLFQKIIGEIAQEDPSVRVWMVFFGEALILKKRPPTIFDMIRYAKDKGLEDVVLNSNGNLLDRGAAERLIESGLDAIYFGVDAHDPDTYAKVRVGGDYHKVVRNILDFVALKNRNKAGAPEITVQFVVMDENEAEVEDFIKFWNDHGVKAKIRPKVTWGGLIDSYKQDLPQEERWPCHWAMRTMSITNLGKVVTCAADLDAAFIAGDVNESTLKEIWSGELKRLRQLHEQGMFDQLPRLCHNCTDWQSARSDYYVTNT